jgi:cation/acetate symporter
MKRLGKYTFTDALDSKFNSKGIQLTAAISTLVVSLCYLIPQMVGAGVLVTPLLGLDHYWGVIMVGVIVILIVATAGMTSTTYVQFLKGGLLIIFSTIICICIFYKGLELVPYPDYHNFKKIDAVVKADKVTIADKAYKVVGKYKNFVKLNKEDINSWWYLKKTPAADKYILEECPSKTLITASNETLYNGAPKSAKRFYQVGHFSKIIVDGKEVKKTGPVGPFKFLEIINDSEIVRFKKNNFTYKDDKVTVWSPNITSGESIMRPGLKFKVAKGATPWTKLDFISLMLALFFGTSALPHILIRYYTVPSQRDARKSTIVAITAIGFFYILTLFMGLGAMVTGVLDLNSSNMSAVLLARQFGILLFSIISAVAFSTVLGTVSGLIVAASGAVAHDIMDNFMGIDFSDHGKVKAGKIAAVVTGLIAIALGIIFKGMNVSFLVGWAFAVAASANLPAILMLLFWKKTTAKGITASITVGMISALTIIMLSPKMWKQFDFSGSAPLLIDNPGIISIPLAFITLVVVSLLTQKDNTKLEENKADLEKSAA